ncbi:T9SS type A sorting domain-containing protein [Bernardetia sp. ABR2-2B]|uniref:T9SS type A sorting domain-containing protein n=1 Tax=Bernardetia sp. ABR2-2B TaxID=3127472 RepID=UPI0030CF2AE1
MNKTIITLLLLIFIGTGIYTKAVAQILVFPTQNQNSSQKLKNNKKLKSLSPRLNKIQRMEEDTILLTLPFFEDFSTTSVGAPDSAKWIKGSGVFINNGIPLNPPTKNVATFDGVAADGKPYDQLFPTRQGLGDTLTSQRFDLTLVNPNQELFFSFMVQARGNGETPDTTDFLKVEFLDNEGNWEQKWEKRGGRIDTKKFEHIIFKIEDEKFFHDSLQFRFTSYNRLSGAFDVWNVDYIYFNTDRSPTDTVFLDVATSQSSAHFIKPYSAVPYQHFWSDTTRFLKDSVFSTVNNLDETFNVIAYQCEVRNEETKDILGYWYGLNDEVISSSTLIEGFEKNKKIVAVPYADLLPQGQDSMTITHQFQVNTREPDENFGGVYTRSNDTISQTSVFKDYYAYDDGTAEYAAGINQRFGQLAYQYYVSQPDILTHIDVYFSRIGASVENQTFNIRVWKKLDLSKTEIKDSLMLTQNSILRYSDNINEFKRIALSRPIDISDTIYIGIQQLGDNMLPIGLDVQTDSKSKMFFNVRNYWEQNEFVDGSLMLRPVFSKEDIVTGVEDITENNEYNLWEQNLLLYPNPAQDKINLKGKVESVQIIDLTGKTLGEYSLNPYSAFAIDREIRLPSSIKNGMYLVRCQYKNFTTVKKLVIQK